MVSIKEVNVRHARHHLGLLDRSTQLDQIGPDSGQIWRSLHRVLKGEVILPDETLPLVVKKAHQLQLSTMADMGTVVFQGQGVESGANKHVCLADLISEQTTPDEFEALVYAYVKARFGEVPKDDQAFLQIRDSLLYMGVFASGTNATFDKESIQAMLNIYFDDLRNVNLITDILVDCGVIGRAPDSDISNETALFLVKYKMQNRQDILERFYGLSKEERVTLLLQLTATQKELSQERYWLFPEAKKALSSILHQYP